ncbi:transporter associated domain-containing protein [Lachnospiraceae bacterium 42-17]|jgi:CBS domain containing-hemolysin-like protein|nr:CBS domain-containing protein [Dorea sp.]
MEDGSLFGRMRQLFQAEEEDGKLGQEAAGLIRNIIRYMDKDAKDIMTHRRNIVAIDGEEKLEDALKFMLKEKYSRFPIFKEGIDEIIGFMHLREAMICYLNKDLRQVQIKELHDYIRPVTFIPETKSIDRLFKEMQAVKSHIVIVIDEYGQTAGLVALEDILEEIVGNILDEYDEEEEEILMQADGSMLVRGIAELERLEDRMSVVFKKEEYETLNGFLIAQLDRIPGEDEMCVVEYEGYRFTVLEVNDNTIQRVKIENLV